MGLNGRNYLYTQFNNYLTDAKALFSSIGTLCHKRSKMNFEQQTVPFLLKSILIPFNHKVNAVRLKDEHMQVKHFERHLLLHVECNICQPDIQG